jgi:hypothetical protein
LRQCSKDCSSNANRKGVHNRFSGTGTNESRRLMGWVQTRLCTVPFLSYKGQILQHTGTCRSADCFLWYTQRCLHGCWAMLPIVLQICECICESRTVSCVCAWLLLYMSGCVKSFKPQCFNRSKLVCRADLQQWQLQAWAASSAGRSAERAWRLPAETDVAVKQTNTPRSSNIAAFMSYSQFSTRYQKTTHCSDSSSSVRHSSDRRIVRR